MTFAEQMVDIQQGRMGVTSQGDLDLGDTVKHKYTAFNSYILLQKRNESKEALQTFKACLNKGNPRY
jgi:hypothetical protein